MDKFLAYLNQTKIQILIIVLLTVLAYSNSLANGLVWDDHLFLEAWPDIQSFDGIGNILRGSTPPGQDKIFRPVRGLIYVFNYSLWGTNSFWYHLQALLIHLSITILVYLIARRIFVILSETKNLKTDLKIFRSAQDDRKVGYLAFFVALIFGLHPIHTETINYISASMETWGTLFFFLSFYFYLLSHSRSPHVIPAKVFDPEAQTRRAGIHIMSYLYGSSIKSRMTLYIGSIISALLAFFTYEMTLTLPILIVLYDVCLGKGRIIPSVIPTKVGIYRSPIKSGMTLKKFLIYIPYFLGVAVFLIIRTSVLGLVSRTDYLGYSFYLTMLTMVKVFLRYILLLIFPINQTAIHNLVGDFPSSMIPYDSLNPILNQSIFDWEVLVSAALLLAPIIFAIKYIKRYSLISFCILWFFISLLPVSYIIPHGGAMAEKYLYVASFGFCLLLAYLFNKVILDPIENLDSRPSGLSLRVEDFRGNDKNKEGNDNLLKGNSGLRRNPGGFKLIFGGIGLLILVYFILTFNRNFVWKSDITLFSDIVAKSPENLIANYTLGIWYARNNDLGKSEEHYKRALDKAPDFWEARYNLGNLYLKAKDFDKATTEYDTLVKTHPELTAAKNALSNIELLRESSESGVLNDQILVNYKSKNGFEFLFPVYWSIKEEAKVVLEAPEGNITVILNAAKRSEESKLDPTLSLRMTEKEAQDDKESYGKLINEGKALIPGWDSAFVRVWEEDESRIMNQESGEKAKKQILEFFLFKDNKVIKILVNPVVPSLMGEVDGILGSIKLQ